MYAAAVDGATAGVCVARCIYPCLFPGEDPAAAGCADDWDEDAEVGLWDRIGVDPDDYLLGLDDMAEDVAAHGLSDAGL